jgi:hypothetical protein
MVLTRYIKIIIGGLAGMVSIWSAIEVIDVCQIVVSIGSTKITGAYACVLLILPILIILGMLRTPKKVAENVEKETGYNWIITIITMVMSIFYSSLTSQKNPFSGNVLSNSWLSIGEKVSLETKMSWLESIKRTITLSDSRWEKVENGLNWDSILSFSDLAVYVQMQLSLLKAVEEHNISRWQVFLDMCSAHPGLALGVTLGTGTLGVYMIWNFHETLLGKLVDLVNLVGQSVENYREYWKVVRQLTADVAKVAEAEALILRSQSVDHEALVKMLAGLKECMTKTEVLIMIKPLAQEITETKVLLGKVMKIIENLRTDG